MNTEEKIAVMFDLAERQQQAASILIKNLDTAVKGIDKTIEASVNRTIDAIARDVQSGLNASLVDFKTNLDDLENQAKEVRDSIESSTFDVQKQLNQTVVKAQSHLDSAIGFFRWRVLLGVSLACFACVSVTFGIYFWLLDDIKTMHETRAVLEREGARMQFSRCGEERRLCIKTDESAPDYVEGFRVVYEK